MDKSGTRAWAVAIIAVVLQGPVAAQGLPEGMSWVQAVHAKVGRSAQRISRQLRNGVYLVHFVIGADGRASDFAIRGSRPEPAQFAMLTGALALTAFPPPPDGRGHAVEVPINVHGGSTPRRR